MSASGNVFDAIIIGGSTGGLAAAAYLAEGGAQVTLLEARNLVGGRAETAELMQGFLAPAMDHTLYALDARIVRDLKLHRHGLRFAERDMALVALRPGGEHLILPRDLFGARAALAAHSPADADAYLDFRREAFGFARRLRALWNGSADWRDAEPDAAMTARHLRLGARDATLLQTLARTSAATYLDRWFESDAVKAALAADACMDGFAPQEAGTALALIWRYAQESCGWQSAVSQPVGGPGTLAAALAQAAESAGAVLRTRARVTSIIIESGRAVGVRLETGETLRASAILSSLDARQTLLGLLPPGALGFGAAAALPEPPRLAMAKLFLALNGPPPFAGLNQRQLRGRILLAERPESAIEAKAAALAGRLPDELVLEATVPSIADPTLAPRGNHVMSLLVPYVPTVLEGGWEEGRDVLGKRVLAALESYAPGLGERVLMAEILSPDDIASRYGGAPGVLAGGMERLLLPYEARVRTQVDGVYLCGHGCEPGGVISGRAGRIAARLVLAGLRRENPA